MTAAPSLCPHCSASGISSPLAVKSHDERALDTAMRRFPYLLALCRQAPENERLAWIKQGDIIAEYRRVVGKES